MKKILVVGSLNMDFVVSVKRMPKPGETLLTEDMELICGGKGANQAYALGKLGADVTLLGAVGKDFYGEMQIDSLTAAGVDTSRIARIDGVSTGIALITVNEEGDNSIIVVQGANKRVDKGYIDSNINLIRESDIVIFQLEIPLDTVVYAVEKCKEFGKTVILDPAPAPGSLPTELLKNVDIIKPNESELAVLTGIEDVKGSMEKAVGFIKRQGVKNVIVTLGGNGSYVFAQDDKVWHIDGEEVKVVDTTAAGDSFIAALAFSITQGKDIIASAKYANRVASIVVTKKGAQSSMPSSDEVAEYFTKISQKSVCDRK